MNRSANNHPPKFTPRIHDLGLEEEDDIVADDVAEEEEDDKEEYPMIEQKRAPPLCR
jgi:hypothetical protein